ncbi:cadherin-7 [Astyanax mexicanus]|uniref:cadherin-7 n=1 Tax=Astyanax mexicanus TaxID=7994 RepID=UPI0020CB50A3|nr:cadherin-7 [Astyanax mexicanus]
MLRSSSTRSSLLVLRVCACLCVCAGLARTSGDHARRAQEGGTNLAPQRAARKNYLSSTSSRTETSPSSKAAWRERDTLKRVRRDAVNNERVMDNEVPLAPTGPLWEGTTRDPSQAAEIRARGSESAGTAVSPLKSNKNSNPSALITTTDSIPNATDTPQSLGSDAWVGDNLPEAQNASTESSLIFQELPGSSENGPPHAGMDPRSRSRRSWIWNQFFVIEEYSGPEPVLIGRLHSSMDRGDGRTKYILKGEGAGSVFVIDGKTGNIHVTKPLDREEKDQYRLIATATDRQTGRPLEASSQFIIRVQDINDNPPLFAHAHYSATVPEMASIGTSVIQVTATDADDETYGNSAKLVYSVVQGQQYFTVDPQSGIVRTAVSDMDREVQSQYVLVLQARDMGGHQGGLTGTTTITVHLSDVNDNPPRFTNSMWSFSVSELALPGVEVGRLSATDADLGENARLDFTITDGEGGGTFNITALHQEGVILLNKVVDYERRSSYTLSVEVQNPTVDPRFLRRGPFKDRATVRITVLNADEPPRFSRARYRLDVSENCPPACAVGRVAAVDPDTGLSSNIKYSIDPESDPEALFRIAPDNGLITTVKELDREREQWHNITVIATQRDSPNQVTRVAVAIETLDLNDNAPELDRQYNAAVCDSSSVGQVVQVIRAIDKDQSSSTSPIHFSLHADSSLALNITVQERGDHTASLVLLSPLKPLPRSASPSLHTVKLPIILRDGASELSSTGTVTLTLCPCQNGGMWAEERKRQTDRGKSEDGQTVMEWERQTVCVSLPSASALLGLSSAAMLAVLACSSTLLVVTALALSVRRQKSDSLSPLEDDEIRENIITYDDEGGGEADTAAFDIAALKSAPHSMHSALRLSRSIYSQENLDRMYSWTQTAAVDPQRPGSAPLYGRFCYSIHTLPAVRDRIGPYDSRLDFTKLAYTLPSGQTPNYGPLDPGSMFTGLAELSPSKDQSTTEEEHKETEDSAENNLKESETGSEVISETQNLSQDQSLNSEGPVFQSSSQSDSSSSADHSAGSLTHHPSTARASSTSTIVSTVATDDTAATTPTTHTPTLQTPTEAPINTSQTSAPFRTMEGTLLRAAGGIPLAGTTCLYPKAGDIVGVYALPGRVAMPFPGGAGLYLGGWGLGRREGEGPVPGPLPGRSGPNPLTHRMSDFLQHRLAQVTFDPMQPPYDSLQTYGLEGAGSQATSLSSLESDCERGTEEEEEIKEWGPKFNKLLEIFRERERKTEEEREGIKEREGGNNKEMEEEKGGNNEEEKEEEMEEKIEEAEAGGQ